MMDRAVMTRYKDEWDIEEGSGLCSCGMRFSDREIILLYPIPGETDAHLREMVCLTCHFWFVHESAEELEA